MTYGIVAEATSDGTGVAGIIATANYDQFFFGTYYGGIFAANGPSPISSFSVKLQDGSEGLNKVLVDVLGDGSANWSSDLNVSSIATSTLIASVSTSADAVRITQTGTGNALVVEDSNNPDATPFVVTATGNVGIGATAPSTALHVSGAMKLTGTFSGNTANSATSDAMVQAVLLYLSNNC